MMDLNQIKFCNIVKLLMGHVKKNHFFLYFVDNIIPTLPTNI